MNVMRMVEGTIGKLGRPVEEFLVSPPLDPLFQDERVLSRLRTHMARAFPKLVFVISNDFPFKDVVDFTVLPVLSAAHPTIRDATVMCRRPTENEMELIQAVLQGFDAEAAVPLLN